MLIDARIARNFPYRVLKTRQKYLTPSKTWGERELWQKASLKPRAIPGRPCQRIKGVNK